MRYIDLAERFPASIVPASYVLFAATQERDPLQKADGSLSFWTGLGRDRAYLAPGVGDGQRRWLTTTRPITRGRARRVRANARCLRAGAQEHDGAQMFRRLL